MPIIIVDANVIVSSPRLRSPEWESRIERRQEWGLRLVVPEVALMETVKTVRNQWQAQRSALAKVKLGEFGLADQQEAMVAEIDSRIEGYEQELSEILQAAGVEVAATPLVHPMEIARRAAASRAPFHSKDKDCYRDALIWHSVLAIAQDSPDEDVWFVSDNHKDFGPVPPHWTGENSGDREDCPILFHTHLAADLKDHGLSKRVRYVVSAKIIERHLAAQFAPVSSDTLRQSVNIADLTAAFKRHVAEFSLDPRETALDPSTRIATIATADPLADTWEFVQGARRRDYRWTARFTVVADTFYARIDRNQKLITDRKPLIFGGDITVAASGEVIELEKASVSALPDDPMRALWPDPEQVEAAMEVVKGLSEPGEVWRAADALRESIPPDQLRQILRDAVRLSGAEERIRQSMTEVLGTAAGQEQLRQIVNDAWNQEQGDQR